MELKAAQYLIKEQNHKWCRVYSDEEKENRVLIVQFDCSSADELCTKLNKFSNEVPGSYYFELKPGGKIKTTAACELYVNCVSPSDQLQGAHSRPAVDVDAMRKQIKDEILQGIKAEQDAKAKQELISDLKEEIQELKKPSGQLAAVFQHLISKYIPQSAPNVSLQGTPGEPRELTQNENEQLTQAVELFLKHTDPPFLLALARKVDQNPQMINTVKSFLGI